MTYLLDTCAISEPRQKKPNPRVIEFLRELLPMDAFISAFTLAEAWKGIELLPLSRRRTEFETWYKNDVLTGFDGRILSFDTAVAQQWGTLAARLIGGGRTMSLIDSLIAATALVHGLIVVTRNETDFAHSGVKILNPWK